jgi:hypothetical protein
MRAVAVEQLEEPVNAELRITGNEQTHVVWHDLQLDQLLPSAFDLLGKDNLQPLIYRRRQHLAPVLWTEDHVVPADKEDSIVAPHVFHAGSIF